MPEKPGPADSEDSGPSDLSEGWGLLSNLEKFFGIRSDLSRGNKIIDLRQSYLLTSLLT
jgi:hypothetical protein